MKKASNILRMDNTADQLHDELIDDAVMKWKAVLEALNVVLTLDKVNQKPLQRTGNVMQKALNDLFFAIQEYGETR